MLNNPELTAFASEYTRYFPLSAGFHNEITTNMVRSGVWGLISSALIFLVPAWFFTSNLSSRDNEVRKLALVASGFIISAFFNAMSTEILNLKYTASFYGLMITILAGSLIILRKSESTQNQLCHWRPHYSRCWHSHDAMETVFRRWRIHLHVAHWLFKFDGRAGRNSHR